MLIVVYILVIIDTARCMTLSLTLYYRGVLTHEVDEGSKCLQCGDGCPGFSLHFWRLVAFREIYLPCNIFSLSRKVCKNCLCPREEHDVRHPEERTDKWWGKFCSHQMQIPIRRNMKMDLITSVS